MRKFNGRHPLLGKILTVNAPNLIVAKKMNPVLVDWEEISMVGKNV